MSEKDTKCFVKLLYFSYFWIKQTLYFLNLKIIAPAIEYLKTIQKYNRNWKLTILKNALVEQQQNI